MKNPIRRAWEWLTGPSQAQLVCWEAYQVVGSLLSDLGKFDTPEAGKILDNLSAGRLVHDDVLPWDSYEASSVIKTETEESNSVHLADGTSSAVCGSTGRTA